MPDTSVLTCTACGETYEHPVGRRGQPPKYCPTCRRPRGVTRDKEGVRRRANAQAKRKAKGAEQAPGPRVVAPRVEPIPRIRVMQYAALLPILGDPEAVADWLHLPVAGQALLELDATARARHPDLVSGSAQGCVRTMRAALSLLSIETMTLTGQMAPRDVPASAQRMAAALGLVEGDERPPEFSSIEIVIRGADGRVIPIGAKKDVA